MKKFLMVEWMAIILVLTIAILTTDVHAQSQKKIVKVDIEKTYESCTFQIEMKEDGKYAVTIISPYGDEYECDKIDSQNFKCVVEDVDPGKWKVKVLNKTGNVGKVSVSVQASRSEDREILSEIRIGKDIVGLREYFKDDDICVEWTDTTVGNVNIRIMNLDNNQLLANETVSGQYYECAIPDGVKNITVSVVPSSSSSINGAEKTYTLAVDNHPDATVTFPEEYFFNTDTISVSMVLNDTYGYMVYDNSRLISQSEPISAGTYELEIPFTKDGEHELLIYITDQAGNMRSTSAVLNRDTTPPYVTMEKEYNGMSVSEETLIIEGSVKDYQTLAINDKQIIPATDGHFEYECTLHQGDNAIVLTATDAAENITEYAITVTYMPSLGGKSDGKPVYIIIVIIAVFVFFISGKRKRKKQKIVIGEE